MSQVAPKPAARQRYAASSASKETEPVKDLACNLAQPLSNPTESLSCDISQMRTTFRDVQASSDSPLELSLKTADTKIGLPIDNFVQPKSLNRKYPKKVFFIIANEFCERFSYYGMRTILVLYFRSVLGFSDANSTVAFHLFATICYAMPILGAILGDSVLGKFKTILYLSIVYLIGELTMVVSSIYWDLNFFSKFTTFAGLLLIGIGTGGIKPCVSGLGGDQFLPHEDRRRQTFFSMFYGAINLGSLISMFLTPILRSDFQCVHRSDCYPYAFALPSVLMFVSIVFFLMAKNHYVIVPLPERNVIIAFCDCVWIALGRKFRRQTMTQSTSSNRIIAPSIDLSSTESTTSSTSGEEPQIEPSNKAISETSQKLAHLNEASYQRSKSQPEMNQKDRSHWLYLASDRYDSKSIEEFRSVLCILLLFLPTPVYWCLFDQQSSLWTLQATRMDGRIFNTSFVLQPDQISVANPLLLVSILPIFEFIIYPSLTRCKLLTKPIQRMTAGGFLAALTFVLSALIEVRIQQAIPAMEPQAGRSSLLLVNGLPDCAIVGPTISYIQIPGIESSSLAPNTSLANRTSYQRESFDYIDPLGSRSIDILSARNSMLNNYQLKFRLATGIEQRIALDMASAAEPKPSQIGCPFDSQLERDFRIVPLPEKSVRLLYVSQANGKLTYDTFDESLKLPKANKARVRLLYEAFGSSAQWERRHFFLAHKLDKPMHTNTSIRQRSPQFDMFTREGQILLSDPLDLEVSSTGDLFSLETNDHLLDEAQALHLKPGTRNLIVVHQRDATHFDVKLTVLQDNDYRISILYQLGPYLLISISEVMFSITGLEFSYAMAPDNMKSVILAAWSMTTAFGNILTVFIESMRLFANVAHEFLFYSLLMALDMLLFAFIGYHYKPYKASKN